ncbi:right-handed parallel beta-helix repeat-containing protein [Vallicoccus soli]|uniref:Right handed beta helix domain-containing protein n=1 Tax=Vallicoccus soli TaxID=2339232 RepID=A0A3A3YXA9_9ACTN|nr:right-handed parallel beta-helix repeat-containing protein [Vallicoccus soli]RJK95353.1 hypothetical protein D5H78_11860 [Vallicoccus soli]
MPLSEVRTPAAPARGRTPARSPLATLLGVLAAVVALAAPLLGAAAPASAAPRTITLAPGPHVRVEFRDAVEALRPGDTLQLAPGTYEIGYLWLKVARGLASAPIVVKAQDWRRPPLLRGGLNLTDADHWTLHRLRVEATAPNGPALHMTGGTGWRVTSSEFFGARNTDAYANVAIDGGGGYPRGFVFSQNCVHDAGRSERWKTDHNIYVKFRGAPGSGGTISKNTIYNHQNGAGIKLGDGGLPGAPGPWGVKVEQNTIAQGGRQVLLSHDVRGNVVVGNLLYGSTEPFTTADRRTTGIYALMVSGTGNKVADNYVARASMALRDPYGKVGVSGVTAVRPDPGFRGTGSCAALDPTYWKARYYGRTSTGVYRS